MLSYLAKNHFVNRVSNSNIDECGTPATRKFPPMCIFYNHIGIRHFFYLKSLMHCKGYLIRKIDTDSGTYH